MFAVIVVHENKLIKGLDMRRPPDARTASVPYSSAYGSPAYGLFKKSP